MNATQSVARRGVLFALACAVSLLLPVTALRAADKALPVTTSFEKIAHPERAPIAMKVKNTSHETLAISGKVLLAVVHHAADKARPLPAHALKAGETMTVTDLSAEDKVVLDAAGFDSLTVVVPFVK